MPPLTLFDTVVVMDTTLTTRDPKSMPPLGNQSAYATCFSNGINECHVCHIPQGSVENRQVINLNKQIISSHLRCRGDYVTTDGTCDLYNPKQTITSHKKIRARTESNVTHSAISDTSSIAETWVNSQALSWKN
jgi:hypothetical protein